MKKILTLSFVLALLSALVTVTVGCSKKEEPRPPAVPGAEKMAPGQASGQYYMQQHGGNPQGGQPAGQMPGGR
jgi:hypothetical protein